MSKESVHSIKYRLKDLDHLKDKLTRKFADVDLTNSEFFSRITDLAGVRILHLHQAQFNEIHSAITRACYELCPCHDNVYG
ncbi:hypothetical protein LL973_20055 [Xanthomonas campestris pv. nigromaculans]|nr:hypothetical protein [Xanthomonas campestris pv. nigromaculans]